MIDRSAVSTSIQPLEDVPDRVWSARWQQLSSALAPQDLSQDRSDAHWTLWCAVAERDGTVLGLLPLWHSRRARFTSDLFDPEKLAPTLFGGSGRDAAGYLLIGGGTELVSGYSLVDGLTPDEQHEIGTALVDAAFSEAEHRGLAGAALYVRQAQLSAFAGDPPNAVRDTAEIGQFAEIEVPVGDFEAYVAALTHSRRSVVRRDIKRLEALGLRGEAVPALDVIDEAADLVVGVKSRHDVIDHPRLAAMRLSRWARRTWGRRIAFTVRSSDGRLVAVSFGCHHGESLELYEIGLADTDHRQLAYFEALVYAPMRFAAEHGCRTLQLGLGASRPKMLRGSSLTPVWAVGRRRGGDNGTE